MSFKNEPYRYIYSGHAMGVAATFDQVDDEFGNDFDVNYVIPVQGAAVLPPDGGLSTATVRHFRYDVSYPRRKTLLAFDRVDCFAEGRELRQGVYQTEVESRVECLNVLNKLFIDHLRMHIVTTRDVNDRTPVITTRGNKIEGVRIGKSVTATITLDDEPLYACATVSQLREYYAAKIKNEWYREKDAWRFGARPGDSDLPVNENGNAYYTLVRDIQLSAEQDAGMRVRKSGNMIELDRFGRIYFGEVIASEYDRRVTLLRLDLGCDDDGSGTGGSGQTNGQTTRP